MFKTDEAKRFFAAWQALRTGDAVPHYRQVFQHLPNAWLPQVLIFEQIFAPEAGQDPQREEDVGRYMVRFMGTRVAEYWRSDITGREMFDLLTPKVAAAARRNLATVLAHPCGLITLGVFTTTTGGELPVESVVVPALNDPGKPARVLGFVQHLPVPFPVADDRHNVAERHWLDIGHGVPKKKPAA